MNQKTIHAGIEARIEQVVSFGRPTCDACNRMAADERPEDGEFWPDTIIMYVNDTTDIMVDRNTRLCPAHDTPEHIPEDATHRVEAHSGYIGDTHRMKTAYEYIVDEVETLAEPTPSPDALAGAIETLDPDDADDMNTLLSIAEAATDRANETTTRWGSSDEYRRKAGKWARIASVVFAQGKHEAEMEAAR